MRRELILGFSAFALVAVALGHDSARAQVPAEGAAAREEAPAPAAPKSLEDQAAQADAYSVEMEGVRSRVRRELERARRERDVVKTLCLNDKLNQIDVALRSAGERKRAHELATKRGDRDLANHEFTILTVLHQRVMQLDSEANQCIGKEVSFIGETSVSSTLDGEMAPEDPSEYAPGSVLILPPQCASCFK
ncbi:MAG: hypothetical protein JRI23_22140 [Deltaproteobacteria bacterium]|jgi:hypothetical protein|nr:hypothetical protein [Deltaproteobacteria bacterium]MBW2534660.1 hypothetical protein [Deltaproteobacteria bacterium]